MSFCDVDSSTVDYARRFSGDVGAWFLDVQHRALNQCLERMFPQDIRGKTALDIGGGHGQIVSSLSRLGLISTLLASDETAIGQALPLVTQQKVACVIGDPLRLPFPDKSFDVVTSFRILPHTQYWHLLIKEMCRVARVGVIVDYPTTQSINCISSLLFSLKKNIEKNTRPYTLFSHRQIVDTFAQQGFSSQSYIGQFVLPMALYRALGSKSFAELSESLLQRLGGATVASPVVEGFHAAQ